MAKFALLGLLDTMERATIRRQELRSLEEQWRHRK